MTSGASSPALDRKYLDWDSSIFGLRIGRVIAPQLDTTSAAEIVRWRDDENLVCVYVLVGSDDPPTVRAAETHGFRFVDIRVTLDRSVDPDAGATLPEGIRIADAADLSALVAIARTSHVGSRFYADARLPRAACDTLHEEWITNACRGRAEAVLVAEHAGRPAGYLAITKPAPDTAQIDLLAVAGDVRERGIGGRLITASLRWSVAHGMARMLVITQARNVAALRLYEASGFRISKVELWYHLWS